MIHKGLPERCSNDVRTKVERRSNDDLTMCIRRCLSESQRKDTKSRGVIVDFSRLLWTLVDIMRKKLCKPADSLSEVGADGAFLLSGVWQRPQRWRKLPSVGGGGWCLSVGPGSRACLSSWVCLPISIWPRWWWVCEILFYNRLSVIFFLLFSIIFCRFVPRCPVPRCPVRRSPMRRRLVLRRTRTCEDWAERNM